MNISDYQSGRFEGHHEYRAFVPEPVCHEWEISDPELVELLGRADRAIGELNAFGQLIPDIDFFIQMHVANEATLSSRIEGTQTNIEDAFKDERELKPEQRDDWVEVQNYIRAINWAIGELERLPLSNRLLRSTHAILMRGARGKNKRPGEFRTSQNWLGPSIRNAVFIPPHHEHVPDLMGDLELFLHDRTIFAHPLIRISIAHYQFETIHPFLDGNGRLGRLMVSLYLASAGLLAKPALYLSDYLERNKTAYVDHLMGVRLGDHLREWLIFFLSGIEETAKASAQVLRLVLDLKASVERDILPRFTARRQENAQKIMQYLYAHPLVDIRRATDLIDGTGNTASVLIGDLVSFGILREITGQRRNRLFVFDDYVALFRR